MKYRATRKDALRWYTCFQVGYCDLQNLFSFVAPRYYTCGVYGWNADVYAFGNNAIVTGYRPFGTKADRKTVEAYDNLAKTIRHENRYTLEEQENLLDLLIDEFLEVLTA